MYSSLVTEKVYLFLSHNWKQDGYPNSNNFIYLFILISAWYYFLGGSRGSVCISKSERNLSFIFFDVFWFVHVPFRCTFPTLLWLVLNFFCLSLLHSLTTRSIISSFSSHNLHLLFYCGLSICLPLLIIISVFVNSFTSVLTGSLGFSLGEMVKAMDCGIVASEFVLQSRYYVHFRANTLGKDMNPLILPAMGQIVPLLSFEKVGFGIK